MIGNGCGLAPADKVVDTECSLGGGSEQFGMSCV